jgi:hypothetical protein
MQGETLESCEVDAPALIEASPDILDALVLDENVVISVASGYIPKPSDDLHALVCSLYLLWWNVESNTFYTNGVADVEKIRKFWAEKVHGEAWVKAFECASKTDYEGLKQKMKQVL